MRFYEVRQRKLDGIVRRAYKSTGAEAREVAKEFAEGRRLTTAGVEISKVVLANKDALVEYLNKLAGFRG